MAFSSYTWRNSFYYGNYPFPPFILQVVMQDISSRIWRGKTKSYWLLRLDKTPEFTIARVGSFIFS